MRFLSTIITALACACAYCVFIPLVTYFQNINEFAFTHISLLKAMTPYFVGVFVAVIVLDICLGRIVPSELTFLFGRRVNVSIVQVMLLCMLIGLVCEGIILSYRLPELTWSDGMFSSRTRIFASTTGWAAGVAIVLWKWRFIARRFSVCAGIPFVMFVAILGDAMLNSEEKASIKASNQDVLERAAFHSRNNIILIMADALPTHAVEEVVKNNKNIAKKLNGFTLFSNNLGPGKQTAWAVPAILQGQSFLGESAEEFFDNVFYARDSLPNRFFSRGYNVYMTSILPRYVAMYSDGVSIAADSSSIPARIDVITYMELGFRFIPYMVKNRIGRYLWSHLITGTMSDDSVNAARNVDGFKKFRALTAKLSAKSNRPTVHWHHYAGAHHPYIYDRDGKKNPEELYTTKEGLIRTSEFILKNFIAFLDELRKRGMYDEATIVLHADHGEYHPVRYASLTSFNTPVLMIKPPGKTDEFSISSASISSVDMVDIVDRLASGAELSVITSKLPQERRFLGNDLFVYAVTESDVTKAQISKLDVQWKDKPTQLEPGEKYSFTRGQTEPHVALLSHSKNVYPYFGLGLDCWFRKDEMFIDLAFAVPSGLKRVSATLSILRANHSLPNKISITDLNSGKILTDLVELSYDRDSELVVEGLTVADAAIRFRLTGLDSGGVFKFGNIVIER